MTQARLASFVCLIIFLAGCGSASRPEISGGTAGKIHKGAAPLVGIQVTVHQFDGETISPIGVAASGLEGLFELVTLDGTGACQLPSGEYRCTLQSAGSPIAIPAQYTNPETTPLKIVLHEDNESFDLNALNLHNES